MRRRLPSVEVSLVERPNRPFYLRYFCPIARRRVEVTSGSMDRKAAEEVAKNIAARLRTGTFAQPLETTWSEFRERYDAEECKPHMRPNGRRGANRALDVFEQIMHPETLAEAVTSDALITFRNRFAAGAKSRFGTRSPHTVKSTMSALLAACRWAEALGLGPQVPRLPKFRPAEGRKAMHGRPISGEEFDRMLAKTAEVVGEKAAESWQHLLRGLWESGLRLDEAWQMSWDLPGTIRPLWRRGALPTILIPGTKQKNRDDDEIPMLPGLEQLLLKTPAEVRTGWVFEPTSLQERIGRRVRHRRTKSEWVSKVIVRIGEAAGVIVEPARGVVPKASGDKPKRPRRTKGYTPPKYASAHDLRRSVADRLEAAGVDPMVIARIMRHKSYETTRRHYAGGNVQRDASSIRAAFGGNLAVADCGASSGVRSDQSTQTT